MGLEELRAQLEAKKIEIREFIKDKKVVEAEKAIEEKRGLEKLIKAAEELEEEEKRDLENQRKKKTQPEENNEFRAIVKTVMGEETTTEERANIKSVDNAAVIPKQFVNKLIEIQKGFGSLKGLCDVIPVTKNEGTIPVIDLDQNEMADVAEGEDIVDGTLVTTDVPFKCAKVGLIQSLASETVDDAEVEMEGLVKKNFANIATVKENAKILKVIKDNATEVVGVTSYEDVEKAIDGSLPSIKAGLVTLTNVAGYVELKNKKDKQGRSLNLITNINGVEYFHEKPIITVDDILLPVSEGKTQVFYVANMNEAVKYCDRKAVTIARSTEAGFKDDTVKLRILERFVPVLGAKRSIKKIEF
ncbi:phage major capsid protein [Clostridium botulinum]|uniref:phage major capsid protein n=1 Tax=Clostridium botulinum TaxID=1491 RepID=UPI000D333498|nr:phage major capsid protein [Clostridium botulinum]AWB30048.1 phage major capsid protein [Clostridium botulinum]MBY6830686.1 phage major capsid protein [Clostridium botulinum]MBY6923952.1 phage major capsid protein [Clostridium botulinum]MBY6940410.1 phage major capsid protein [Clostridium botulinum]MBY6961191.1 phage major capsid protein [Clostridium botulinum]